MSWDDLFGDLVIGGGIAPSEVSRMPLDEFVMYHRQVMRLKGGAARDE